MLRRLVGEILTDAGFDVLEAHDGHEALQKLLHHRNVVLLISDVRMPGMSGYELAGAAQSLCPQLKIVLLTGCADDKLLNHIESGEYHILIKPFDIERLPRLARELCEG